MIWTLAISGLTTLALPNGISILQTIGTLITFALGQWAVIDTIMALCINCNFAIPVTQRYNYVAINMSPEIVTIIEEWTGQEITQDDHICQECFDYLIAELNNQSGGNIGMRQLDHLSVCVSCGISLHMRSNRRSYALPEGRPERHHIATRISPRQIPADARVCSRCWQRAYQAHRNEPVIEAPVEMEIENLLSSSDQEPMSFPSSEMFQLNDNISNINLRGYSRTADTSSVCFVPACVNPERLRVPIYLRRKILADYKVFITSNARVCQHHASIFNWDLLEQHLFSTEFTVEYILEMLELLRKEPKFNLDFENIDSMNNNICKFWTGLNVADFLVILNIILVQLRMTCRKPRTALAVYLIKLRTGEPIRRIASLLCISKSLASVYIAKARHCVVTFYVPVNLGINHLTRENVANRNLIIPQGLFGTAENNPIIICDGTYIYLQKSSNYLFQKKSYSLHKYTNLVKPFLLVATDGHIIDIFGPYAATTSDATIALRLFENENSQLRQYFQENDVFILDRGFRDAIPLLTSLGYNIYKPESLHPGETQLSTLNANKSRLVTLCRWVVEVVNGRFKRDFKIFRHKYFNLGARNLMDDFKVAAAIINNFHPVLTDRNDAQEILERATSRMNVNNYLADHVIEHQLNRRRANFVYINGELPQLDVFPIMEMRDLILFALGVYQIKQARSYYGEHIRQNGSFIIEVSDDVNFTNVPGISSSLETVLLRGRIKSRHQSNKIYYTYILINIEGSNWDDKIKGYYCSCLIGKRTVGCCAHVMTIVWYLGWARHQTEILPPAQFLDYICVREDIENE